MDVTLSTDLPPTHDEVNAAYGWPGWPQREAWRLDAIARSCTWVTARSGDGSVLGLCRLLDDGGLHASLWDLLVHPDHRRRGIGTGLVEHALDMVHDRSLLVVVATPESVGLFRRLGLVAESHGHTALYTRPFTRET